MTVPLIRLNKGDYIEIDGVRWDERERTTSTLVLQKFDSTELRTFDGEQLRDLYFAEGRRMRIVRREVQPLDEKVRERIQRPFDTFDAQQQGEMLVRLDYVKACDRFFARGLYPRTIDGYDRIAKIVGRFRRLLTARNSGRKSCQVPLEIFSGSTLRDWYVRWRRGVRHIGALAPLTERKGNRRERMDPAVARLVAYGVNHKWLTLEAPPVTVVHDFICREVRKLNETMGKTHREPSEMAVRRWIRKNIDGFTEVLHRKGRKEAEHQFRLTKQAPVAIRPLQIVEFDETPLDIILVDGNGDTQGRAYLTAGTCLATGMVVGWHIGTEKPSWTTLMQALRMAVLKKDTSGCGCESPYPVYGVPEMVKCDNGAPYRSTSLVAAAGQLQFELRLVPVGRPHLKGKVERFFLEVARDFASVLPGRTFSNIQQRGDYNPAECADFTIEEIRKLFTRWVVDIYHNRPNSRAFGQTPLERWQALSGCGVRLPPEKSDLAALIGLVVKRTILAEGIHFMGLRYAGEKLRALKQGDKLHLGREWMVKIDPLDITHMLVLDERNHTWTAVRCQQMDLVVDQDDRPFTLREWMLVVKAARKRTKAGQRVTRGTLLRAREYILKVAEEKGNVRKGESTERDREWLQEEVVKLEYDIDSEFAKKPDTTSGKSKPPGRKKRSGPQRPSDEGDGAAVPASKAGGIPLPEVEIDDAAEEAMAAALRQVEREKQQAAVKALRKASRVAQKKKATDTDAAAAAVNGGGETGGELPFVENGPPIAPDGRPSRNGDSPSATRRKPRRRPANTSDEFINPHDPARWGRANTEQNGEAK